MDELKTEYILFDKCKCCLGEESLKEMWGEYMFNDRREVYGDMLMECFSLQFHASPDPDNHVDQICSSCVTKLRNALDFKREVVACEQLRYEHLTNGLQVKQEHNEVEVDTMVYNEVEVNGEVVVHGEMVVNGEMGMNGIEMHDYEDVQYLEIDDCETELVVVKKELNDTERECGEGAACNEGEASEAKPAVAGGCGEDYEDVQYLDIDDVDEKPRKPQPRKRGRPRKVDVQAKRNDVTPTRDEDSDPEKPKRKWPRKKKKHEKMTLYKQYTRDDMLKALEAVESGNLSKSEAAKKFNVPRKTLTAKLLVAKNKTAYDKEKEEKTMRYFKLIDEVRNILRYTNAIPFKTVTARFFCAYCSMDGPIFEEPEELRIHTRTQHVDERIKNIEMAMRPHWQNEVLKMDIDSLHCTVCCIVLANWNLMFEHLQDVHKVELEEAYTKVIPFILDRDYKCALCSKGFPNYHHLDSHMNAHYLNHICSDCGDTFLSTSRMSKHIQVHETGRYPCEACGKVFTRTKYRQKHFNHVHKQEHKIKCWYCTEKFYGLYQRHLHVVKCHKEKVKITTCELCGLRFDWKPYYLAHLRRKHNMKKES